jgi:hypothetical protein
MEVLSLNAYLSELERADPCAARVVELCFFGGLDVPKSLESSALRRSR